MATENRGYTAIWQLKRGRAHLGKCVLRWAKRKSSQCVSHWTPLQKIHDPSWTPLWRILMKHVGRHCEILSCPTLDAIEKNPHDPHWTPLQNILMTTLDAIEKNPQAPTVDVNVKNSHVLCCMPLWRIIMAQVDRFCKVFSCPLLDSIAPKQECSLLGSS